MRIVSEPEFRMQLRAMLRAQRPDVGSVTGPGRSGAIAAVYASHMLRVPFIPYGSKAPADLGAILVIDTAQQSGRTIRKAVRRYERQGPVVSMVLYNEPPRVAFWYEAPKPQHFRHERSAA